MPYNMKMKTALLFCGAIIYLGCFDNETSIVDRYRDENGEPLASHYFVPQKSVLQFTFGYNEVYSDSLWIRLLQDYGVCEQKRIPEGGVRIGKNRVADCEFGWSYQMLELISELTPRNRLAHKLGPMMLSVIVDDRAGATKIYEKSLQRFPGDAEIFYEAGYHFMLEEEDLDRAADLYKKAADLGGPEWLYSLASTLHRKQGRLKVARQVLINYLESSPEDERSRNKALSRLKEIEKMIMESD